MPVIHWFRRDLRLTDNTALNRARRVTAAIIPVYVVSGWRGDRPWTGPPRQEFLAGCLAALAGDLRRIGGHLIVRRGPAEAALARLIAETGATAIYFNRDPDPAGRATEDRVERLARDRGCAAVACQDVGLHERAEVVTARGEPFRVFTPYARAWWKLPKPAPGPTAGRLATPACIATEPLPTLATWGLAATATILEPGERAARRRLAAFLRGPLFRYGSERDRLAADATSRLSADLRFGTLSIREVFARCEAAARDATAADRRSAMTFLNELVWREFYQQILWHFPGVLDGDFSPRYRAVRWRRPGAAFDRWATGTTGFPLVDAGMRQLLATGFLHNRARMIVAMFLTKDLHIHWRAGEQLFMRHLVDGDIAANNGGWQWSAGTGADAAPYFRIQNPWTQAKRYDPDGAYIKRWVPELATVPAARLMAPPPAGTGIAPGYPRPMVDHAAERAVTLALFRL